MNKLYKVAMLATLGLASITTSQAAYNNDLLVGFTTQSGTDLVYDLGSAANVFNGTQTTWDLSAALTAAGLSGSLSSVQWGVVGDASVVGVRTSWLTFAGETPNPVPNRAAFNNIDSADATIASSLSGGLGTYGTPDSSVTYSWNGETALGGSALGGAFSAVSQNPNLVGLTTGAFWQQIANGSSPTLMGSFTLGSDSILTFAPVPEPTTTALMAAGGGLLMLIGRNKLGRKQS